VEDRALGLHSKERPSAEQPLLPVRREAPFWARGLWAEHFNKRETQNFLAVLTAGLRSYYCVH
jgi:hypothetical protein